MEFTDDYGEPIFKLMWKSLKQDFSSNFVKAFICCSVFWFMSGCLFGYCNGCTRDNDADYDICKTKLENSENNLKVYKSELHSSRTAESQKEVADAADGKTSHPEIDYKYTLQQSGLYFYADDIRYNEGFASFTDKDNNADYILGGTILVKEVNKKKEEKAKEEY